MRAHQPLVAFACRRIHQALIGETDGDLIPATEIRDGKDGQKLLVAPVKFKQNSAGFVVEMRW